MGLTEYHRKRNFRKTSEPRDKGSAEKHKRLFVVQEHHASHLHYDFRLELNGVLKSWAVPKGPSQNTHVKRLAVEVEDHPLSYAGFEGRIPKGEYGAGTVKIWDHGEWIPTESPNYQLKKGHLEFELKGEQLTGKWMLVRTNLRGSGKKSNWLLIKKSDISAATKPGVVKKEKLPAFIEPQLASLSLHPPDSKNWIHEIKLDGYRTACHLQNGKVKFLTRNGLDWTNKYKSLATEVKKIRASSAYLDGEVVCIDEKGKTHFQDLQNTLKEKMTDRLYYSVFDLLHLDGENLRSLPLLERKQRLQKLLKKTKLTKIIYHEHWGQRGSEIFHSSCKLGLEGIISKNAGKAHECGRSKDWLKSKCKHVQEFIIGGYTTQKNETGLGALLLGAFDEKNQLRYVGRVGTGFNNSESTLLMKKLKKIKSSENPFETKYAGGKNVHFVKPRLVAQVEFGAWTDVKILRHASYQGLRSDKKPGEVYLDEPSSKAKIQLTHPDKILFSLSQNTKQDLADYYSEIQKWILPHLSQRPLSLLRCPAGAEKSCFFQKHLKAPGHGISTQTTRSKTTAKNQELIFINHLQGLLGLVQINALELHSWGCHIDNIDSPDLIVFDLDPDKEVAWADVKKAALRLKKILGQLGLESFLKVTGGKGLHLHVPIAPVYSWEQIKGFAKTICDQLVNEDPSLFLTTANKAKRRKKIFLDYLRNGYGATAIVPYSVRAQPQASVALPISWKELTRLKNANSFTLEKVQKLMKRRRDPWAGYFNIQQRISLLDKLTK